ncbi:hypothetical protein BN59_01075 [Legionella massiliensis]|uniref:KfrA N-terminal DNA-binding domain-containing protein n=1 Tax=Legionella massiliensis TaxID=1034943 RepID=A0A078KYE6_9GAMM|nr:hypothetical protein [Legionella massiliensis]CDZ76799.1 hypothetical protein BN59_01075 [Legionella massiliensis]CEE12537.1 hypothetical protein BN1094_01075 [Legionella massiliensis]
MKKDNKFHTIELINDLFKQNGQKEIPDIKEICSKANTNRNTAIKYLYEWWENYSSGKNGLLNFKFVINSDELEQALAQLQCLAKELEVHYDSLNYLSNQSYPLGNFILHSLQDIEHKLISNYEYLRELKEDKKGVEEQLSDALHENRRLEEMQRITTRKQEQIQEQLDAKRREILAAKHLIKALKREKRRPTQKDIFYNYNAISR